MGLVLVVTCTVSICKHNISCMTGDKNLYVHSTLQGCFHITKIWGHLYYTSVNAIMSLFHCSIDISTVYKHFAVFFKGKGKWAYCRWTDGIGGLVFSGHLEYVYICPISEPLSNTFSISGDIAVQSYMVHKVLTENRDFKEVDSDSKNWQAPSLHI